MVFFGIIWGGLTKPLKYAMMYSHLLITYNGVVRRWQDREKEKIT